MAFDAQTIFVIKDVPLGPIRAVRAVVIPQGHACLVDGENKALPGEGLINPDEWELTFAKAAKIAEKRRDVQIRKLSDQIAVMQAVDFSQPVEG